METNDAGAVEGAWLEAVGRSLVGRDGSAVAAPADADVRALLKVTKITADVTGVRYLAPLTAYLIGIAAGRAGPGFEVRTAVDAISRLAEGWTPPPSGG